MEAINSVRRLIAQMTEEEKGVLRDYLRVFNNRKSLNNKSLKLFDLLATKNEEVEDERALEFMVYGKYQSPGTFIRLVLRVRNKILQSLIVDVNIYRPNSYSERDKTSAEVRNRITQAQILMGRKDLLDMTTELLEEATSNSKKYELYEELLLAIRMSIAVLKLKGKIEGVNKLLEQYHRYSDFQNAVLEAETAYMEVLFKVDYFTNKNIELHWMGNILERLRNDFTRTDSAQIGLRYYYIETQYFQLKKEYRNARKSLEELQKLLENKPSIYTEKRYGSLLLNQADNEIYLNQLEASFELANKSLKYFTKGSFNYAQGIELMFYSKFYSRRYIKALEILEEILPTEINNGIKDFRIGKRLYLKANCLFILRDFNTALLLLSQINPIEEDKEGWNIGVRTLTIMCLLELDMREEAAAKISALARYITFHNKDTFNPRVRTIYSILLKFKPVEFDFKTVYQKEVKKIEQLGGTDPKFQWHIKSPEMVAFHQWLIAKVFNQKFVQKIPEKSSVTVNEQ